MKLYIAHITCKLKSSWLGDIPADTVFQFQHAIASEGAVGAQQILQSTFPWTFYKHVKVTWKCISEKS